MSRFTLNPSLEEVRALPADAAVPLRMTIPADSETPVTAYSKLRRGGTGFLLESAERDGRLGRYSFIGVSPDAVLRAGAEAGTVESEEGLAAYRGGPLEALRRLVGDAPVVHGVGGGGATTPGDGGATAAGTADAAHPGAGDLPAFVGGAVGAFGYDLVRVLERLPDGPADDGGFPAALFARYDSVVIFDHLRQRLHLVSMILPGAPREDGYGRARERIETLLGALRRAPSAPPFRPAIEPEDPRRLGERARCSFGESEFLSAVAHARELILEGEAIQVVLSRRLDVPFAADPFRLYRALRLLSPSPYMFFLEFPELALVGASPEMLLRVSGDAAQLCPIAGTRPRGAGEAEDRALEEELHADPKERAEHVMLVDLARNDLGRVCTAGSVKVPRLMEPERFSHVIHLVSAVTGRLAPGVDALDAFAACFPAGTVSGAPKVRAMEIIDEMEPVGRGAYAGAVGYVGFGGHSLDTCITLRSAVLRGGVAQVQAGAGIVADSDPHRELEETRAKAAALLEALALAGGAPESAEAVERKGAAA